MLLDKLNICNSKMNNNLDFNGKIALITGASSGIGAQLAEQLHALGCNLVLIARREELLKELTEKLNIQRENSATFIVTDLADTDQVDSLCRYIKENRIDILINNAGFGSFGPFETLDLKKEQHMVQVNDTSHLCLTHAVIPQMKERKAGYILNVSSIAGFQPLPLMTTYAATKAFNLFFSLGLRYELAKENIRVIALCPGPVETEFGGVARVPGEITGAVRSSVEQVVAETIIGMKKNKAFMTPCTKSKLTGFLSRMAPFTLSSWIVERMLRQVYFASLK